MSVNIKMDLKETGCGLDSIGLGYGPVAAFLNTVMILPEPQKQGIS
jgi:hypothetical protein